MELRSTAVALAARARGDLHQPSWIHHFKEEAAGEVMGAGEGMVINNQ